MQKQET